MDGVIVDSNPFHKIALKQFCEKYGHHLTEEDLVKKIYGRRNEDWLMNIFGPLDPDQLNRYADEKEALFRELYDGEIKPVAGLPRFLEQLDELGIQRVIATSAPRANVDFTLVKTGTVNYFETILDSSHVSRGKPDPEVYLKAAGAVQALPENCVVFEDSLAGVEAARRAGCKVVGITTTHSAAELRQTDMVIDNFAGIDPREVIQRLYGS